MRSTDPEAHFDESDYMRLAKATTFEHLRDVALDVLLRMPDDVHIVSGPMGTGGVGYLDGNMAIFRAAISALAVRGINVFTQLIFQEHMLRFLSGADFYKDGDLVLETFYQPLFCSQKVSTVCFLPLWRTSRGATWEQKLACELNLRRLYFAEDWHTCPPETSILFP